MKLDCEVNIKIKGLRHSLSPTGSASKNSLVPSLKNFKNINDPLLKQYGRNAPEGVFLGFWTPILP